MLPARRNNAITALCGAAVATLAAVILIGWWTEHPFLVRLGAGGPVMRFNTALLFCAVGLALVAIAADKSPWARLAGAIVTVFAAVTLAQFPLKTDLGIDALLYSSPFDEVPLAGARMAANTATCFVLIGLALVLFASRQWRLWRLPATAMLASAVFAIASVALLGHVAGLTAAHGWGGSYGMSVPTASTFIVSGGWLTALALEQKVQLRGRVSLWLSLAVGNAAMIGAFILWQALEYQDSEQIRRTVEADFRALASELVAQLRHHEQALLRMGARWDESGRPTEAAWRGDARNYLAGFEGFRGLAWIDDEGRVRWVISADGNDAALADDVDRLSFEEVGRTRSPGRPTVILPGAPLGASFLEPWLVVPVLGQGNPDGRVAAALALKRLVDTILGRGRMQGQAIVVSGGNRVLFDSDAEADCDPALRQTAELPVADVVWTLTTCPTRRWVASQRSLLPEVTLGAGLALALLATITLQLAASSREHWRQATAAYAQLSDSEAKARAMFETAADAIVWIDERGTIEAFNPSAEKMFGHAADAFVGQKINALMPSPYRDEHDTYLANYLRTGVRKVLGMTREVVGLRRDGTRFPIEMMVSEVMLKGRRTFTGIVRDITDRTRREQSLRTYAARTQLLLENMERLTRTMAAVLSAFEGTADDCIYAVVLRIVLGDFHSRAGFFVRFTEDGPLFGPYASPCDSGEFCWLPSEWCASWKAALRDGQGVLDNAPCRMADLLTLRRSLVTPILHRGKVLGLLHVADRPSDYDEHDQDVLVRVAQLIGPVLSARLDRDREERDRMRAETQLDEHRAALARVLRLNTMGEMAAGIAHELNQPLSAIANFARGAVRRLNDGYDDAAALLDVTRSIADEAARATDIMRSLKRHARKCEPERATLDINSVVHDAAQIVAGEGHQRGVAIVLRCAWDLDEIRGDSIQLEQVLVNLLCNALDALAERPADGLVTVETRCAGADGVEVLVEDNGCGLPRQAGIDIFEAFFTTKTGGLGMGLAISRSIVEAHGGHLSAEANAHGGATFRFTLPREHEVCL